MTISIFQKIIAGVVPCHRLYEDAHVLAFLDIAPMSTGHALLVPKESAVTLDALSDEASAAVGRALPRICRALMRATETSAYNLLQNNGPLAGQVVPHVHFHIIPKREHEGLGVHNEARPLDEALAQALSARVRQLIEES